MTITFSDNLTGQLDDAGTLTISGTGDMECRPQLDLLDCPFLVKKIVIESGVTSIGYETFSGCRNLTSFTIHDGVKKIGANAFSDCRNLTSLTIHDGGEKIDAGAFSGYTNLTIYYPAGRVFEEILYAGNVVELIAY